MRPLPALLSLVLLLLAVVADAAPARCYDWLLREKLRGGYLSSADLGPDLARAKAAGMNALLPKFGGLQAPPTEANIALLKRWGEVARQQGMHLLPVFNFRGGETEKLLSERREVTAAGLKLQRTPCPLDEPFWDRYILGRALALAEHAREWGLDGAILDPEMYGADHTVYGGVCYCDDCLREFAAARGLTLPAPLPTDRQAWLKGQGLEAAFTERFVSRVEGFCRRIEQQVHAANPDFVLGVLLLDYPLPFMRGMARGLGTATYPVLGFSETTYSSGYSDYVGKQQQAFAAMPAQVLFVPGLWQQQFPSENLAEQYYTCAAHSAGYWIYTLESLLEDVSKLPGYQLREPGERYWEAMRLANGELDKLAAAGPGYVSALKVRAFEAPLPVLSTADLTIPRLVPAPDAAPQSRGEATAPRLRYRNPLFILGKAGEPVRVRVENRQLANYLPGTQWVLCGPDGTHLQEGRLKVRETAEVAFTPAKDGTYLLVAASGQNAQELCLLSGQPYGLSATKQHPLIVNGSLGRLYFHVPGGVSEFSLFVKAEGQAAGRGGKLALVAPDGQTAAHLEGDLGQWTELKVPVTQEERGRVWCLTGEDITNDLTLYFSPGVPGYLCPDPRHVVTAAAE